LIYNESKTEAVLKEEEQAGCCRDCGARLVVAGIVGPIRKSTWTPHV